MHHIRIVSNANIYVYRNSAQHLCCCCCCYFLFGIAHCSFFIGFYSYTTDTTMSAHLQKYKISNKPMYMYRLPILMCMCVYLLQIICHELTALFNYIFVWAIKSPTSYICVIIQLVGSFTSHLNQTYFNRALH